MGIGIIALPTGIISSGFVELKQSQENDIRKHIRKRKTNKRKRIKK